MVSFAVPSKARTRVPSVCRDVCPDRHLGHPENSSPLRSLLAQVETQTWETAPGMNARTPREPKGCYPWVGDGSERLRIKDTHSVSPSFKLLLGQVWSHASFISSHGFLELQLVLPEVPQLSAPWVTVHSALCPRCLTSLH